MEIKFPINEPRAVVPMNQDLKEEAMIAFTKGGGGVFGGQFKIGTVRTSFKFFDCPPAHTALRDP